MSLATGSFKSPPHSPEAEAYWGGLREGRIVLQRCADCGEWTHPPTSRCRNCSSERKTYHALSGRGVVYTYTITYKALSDEFQKDLPLVIAYVALDEGPRIVSWVRGVEPSDVRVGMRVEAEFEKIDEKTTLHRFHPVATG